MKKFICLALALCCQAKALDPFAYQGLIGVEPCNISGPILFFDKNTSEWLGADFKNKLSDKVMYRLIAYKIKSGESCSKVGARFVNVNVFATIPATTRAYNVNTQVNFLASPIGNSVITWETTDFGFTQKDLAESQRIIEGAVMDQIDRLAADYAKANP